MGREYLFALLMPLALSACLGACQRAPENQAKPAAVNRDLPILKVTAGAPLEYTSVGSVVSDQRVDVSSRLSGYIREIRVHEGDRVRHGQVMARLDAADVDGGIRQSQAGVAAADAAFRDAQADLERFERLYERGSVSENELRKIRLKHDASRESLNQARALADTARSQRDYSEIRSPVDGIVVARTKRAGDLALPGVPILTLESGHGLLFETFVAGEHLAAIAPGQAVDVRIDGLDRAIKGTVARVVSSADPVTRSYPVKITLPESDGLVPGRFGRAAFVLGQSPSMIVPSKALVERGGLRGVFLVERDNTARFRWLRIGREWTDRVEVTAGLQGGERLVATADSALRDGDTITGAEPGHE